MVASLIHVSAEGGVMLPFKSMIENQILDARSRSLLMRVSEALGLPLEAFYSDAPGEAGELLTLMRLWSAIEDKQARQRILTIAKQEFERSASTYKT